jgi:hypothetical protein
MRYGHSELDELVGDLRLRILQLVFEEAVAMVELLSQCKLSHLVVDLGQLLHL